MLIEDLNSALGGYIWLARRTAQSLGPRPEQPEGQSEAAVAVCLHTAARRFAQHGAGWEALAADSPALAAQTRVRAPSEGWDELFEHLLDPAVTDLQRLAMLVEVLLPRIEGSLEQFAAQLGDVAEAAEARFCAIVRQDLAALSARGSALLDELRPSESRPAAAEALQRFDHLFDHLAGPGG